MGIIRTLEWALKEIIYPSRPRFMNEYRWQIIWICSKTRVHQKSFSRDTTPFPIRDILQVPQEIYFIGKVSTTSTKFPFIDNFIHGFYRMSRFLRTFEANPPKRHGKMDKQIELSQTEIELAFASFCIEGTARNWGSLTKRCSHAWNG